jgi:serine protease AprX
MTNRYVTKSIKHLAKLLTVVPALALLALPLSASPVTADSTGLQKVSPALLAEMTAYPTAWIPVVVEMNAAAPPFSSGGNQTLAQQAVSILNANGQAFGALSIIQGAAGVSTSAGITAMSLLPQVATIEQDAVVQPRRPANSSTTNPPAALTSLYPQEVHADRVWQQGGSGRGITVAVLDSGVAPDADLGSRVLAQVSFAGAYDPSHPDKGGHGTHIAGTIAGSGVRSNYQYVGMAPNANIISVQVLDQNGNGRISSIIRGIEWVIAHQYQYNIRVINMSFGAASQGSYKFDPIDAASEIAWKRGIAVIAAVGNSGPNSGTVESPGDDPFIITVGSTDDQATLTLSDDTLGWWSSWGVPQDSTAKPDLISPGRRVVSTLVPGSTLATDLPDHIVYATNGTPYLRLTGTSMSTAVVSGAVALLLEHQQGLTPDQVKKILVSTTQPFGAGSAPAGAGAGLLDANAAWSSSVRGTTNAGQRMSDSAARLVYALIYNNAPLVWKNLTYLGTNWSGYTWLNLPWNDPTWDNIAWDNIAWDNIAWDNIAWDQTSWDNIAWDNIAWDNIAWDSSGWNNIAWDSFKFD